MSLKLIVSTLILTILYTVAMIKDTYRLAVQVQPHFRLFAFLIFFVSFFVTGAIVQMLHTAKLKHIRYSGLAIVVLTISFIVIGLPQLQLPLRGIYQLIFLMLGIAWLVIVSYPKLGSHNRYRWLSVPFMLLLAIISYHHFIPETSCAISGGSWIEDGVLGQVQHCLYVYPDSGQVCESSEECLGGCIVSEWPNGEPRTSGSCKPTTSPFGCYAYIENQEWFSCRD